MDGIIDDRQLRVVFDSLRKDVREYFTSKCLDSRESYEKRIGAKFHNEDSELKKRVSVFGEYLVHDKNLTEILHIDNGGAVQNTGEYELANDYVRCVLGRHCDVAKLLSVGRGNGKF